MQWSEATDRRVQLLGSVISSMLPIKLNAYEEDVCSKYLHLRDIEM